MALVEVSEEVEVEQDRRDRAALLRVEARPRGEQPGHGDVEVAPVPQAGQRVADRPRRPPGRAGLDVVRARALICDAMSGIVSSSSAVKARARSAGATVQGPDHDAVAEQRE